MSLAISRYTTLSVDTKETMQRCWLAREITKRHLGAA